MGPSSRSKGRVRAKGGRRRGAGRSDRSGARAPIADERLLAALARRIETPLIALVGRPNVGKSTLFNRLTRSRQALVDDLPGVTRDRQYGQALWFDLPYRLIDTGGFEGDPDSPMGGQVRDQTLLALEEADAVIFVTDAPAGPLPDDHAIADLLRRGAKPVVCAVNKSESRHQRHAVHEFHALGLAELIPISAAHGEGIDEMMEALWRALPEPPEAPEPVAWPDADGFEGEGDSGDAGEIHSGGEAEAGAPLAGEAPVEVAGAAGELGEPGGFAAGGETPAALADPASAEAVGAGTAADRDGEPLPLVEDAPVIAKPPEAPPGRIAVIGCPNAGKSSLINRLLGEERLVASDQPGTTRDSIDLPFTAPDGRRYLLVDTAGIRRKSRVSQRLEKFSVIMALKAIDRADAAVLVIDGERGLTDQDKRVAGYAVDAGCGLVLAVNKWDLAGRQPNALKRFKEEIERGLPHLSHAPALFLSAKSGAGMKKLLPTVERVLKATRRRISTGQLNRWLKETVERHPPPRAPGGAVKIRYASQVSVAPPTLLLFANRPEQIHATYRRYLENQLRARFNFDGAPLRIVFRRGGENPYAPGEK